MSDLKTSIILDLTGTSHVHGHPEEDRVYSLDGRGISRDAEAPAQLYCRVCGAPITAGEACPECGTEPRVTEQRVTGEALVPYAAKRRETPDQRAATLARWIAHASQARRADGSPYSRNYPLAKFRAVYGYWPGDREVAAARALIGRAV